jgi:hypothetical protein
LPIGRALEQEPAQLVARRAEQRASRSELVVVAPDRRHVHF